MDRAALLANRNLEVGAGVDHGERLRAGLTQPAPTHWNHGPTSSVATKLTTLAAWTRPDGQAR